MMMTDDKQPELLARLNKIEGQIRGIRGMLEKERACEDVVTQLAAARAALDQVGFLFVSTRMQECISNGEMEGHSKDEALEKLMKLFLKLA